MTHIETYLDGDIDGIPSDYSDELFDALDKCKATGTITSITKPINIISKCYNLRLELEDGTNQYSLYGIGNNPSCHAKLGYNLSGNNFPKIGEHINVIAEISTNYIVSIGDEIYNGNVSLPNCPYYYEEIIGGIIYDNVEISQTGSDEEIQNSKTDFAKETPTTISQKEQTPTIKEISKNNNGSKITPPPIIVDEKITEELSQTGIENIENSGTLSTNNTEVNSGNLSQNEIENHKNIEEIQITSNTETINIVKYPSQKIDSSFYIIGGIIFLIIIGFFIFKFYKKK